MKTYGRTHLLALVAATGFVASGEAYGQRPSRYTPSRPTVSPYFNLFRTNTGGLPNYQMFYQRDEQLRSTLRRQQRQLGTLQQEFQGTTAPPATGMMAGRASQTMRRGATRARARAAKFMDYSQFFPNAGSVRRKR